MSTVAQQRTKNVIMISMDGYRWRELFAGADSLLLASRKYNSQDSAWRYAKYWAPTPAARREKLMPFVWQTIARKGQLYGNRQLDNKVDFRNTFWFSYPGRAEVLTGYSDPAINSNSYPDNPNENILEFVNKQKGYAGKVATFASWDVVARIVNRNRNGMLVNIYGEDVKDENLTALQQAANSMQRFLPDFFGRGERLDGNTYLLAKSYLLAKKPRVMYIDLADTDVFGHDGKYDFFLDAAHYADAMIADLWAYLQQDSFYKDQTTILIYPDHGRGEDKQWVSHGGQVAHAGESYLLVMGPDTTPTGEQQSPGQLFMDQCAQTVARLLGFMFKPVHPVGNAISTVLK
ncbi:alkaline phosphatase family protein [Paraflavitalea pollutisoli]|uniref:alkaline phosphatase family protein n=1 Tax=Paraflavitalea pollutisoli TaxID=3034143 RepID=UPI0023ED0588|nr:alkaline phosphatase family protein [Paraflavitalea sp. H1-2-19X]